jgi:hypothetical protein
MELHCSEEVITNYYQIGDGVTVKPYCKRSGRKFSSFGILKKSCTCMGSDLQEHISSQSPSISSALAFLPYIYLNPLPQSYAPNQSHQRKLHLHAPYRNLRHLLLVITEDTRPHLLSHAISVSALSCSNELSRSFQYQTTIHRQASAY